MFIFIFMYRDKSCTEAIPRDASGFCECGGGRITLRRNCDQVSGDIDWVLTCRDACSRDISSEYYEALELPFGADIKRIKKAWRKLSLKYHPDTIHRASDGSIDRDDADSRFQKIRTSYELLSDESKKILYDSNGPSVVRALEKQGSIKKAPKMKATLEVTYEQIYRGVDIRVSIDRKVVCGGCPVDATIARCSKCTNSCSDTTEVRPVKFGGFMVNQRVKVRAKLMCRSEPITLTCEIERGVASGHSVTFAGKGEQIPGMLPGDIEIELSVKSHETFKRRNNDLYMTVPISLKEALLGFTRDVVHLDGHSVKVSSPRENGKPKIVAPRQELVIQDEGMPHHGDPSKRGSLYVKLRVAMPAELNDETREWLGMHFPDD
eukprot:g4485.t1